MFYDHTTMLRNTKVRLLIGIYRLIGINQIFESPSKSQIRADHQDY